ncbi:HupE/UreJ family protein [Microvirga yunnanensis]|uniref:HupE/UreJ family protein n=1 Tax=Microvirga yunnanensis TaxID=2953740 RepID=UPI0021C785B8|nr:HupE/UreJ family protein [Microvirga sp. HBU65207]
MFKRSVLATLFMAAAMPALAHTGHASASGFVSGFSHPLGGIDHVLAMVSVGLFAALLGGRAMWALPASFVGMMLAGGILGLTGIAIPAVEFGITLSVVVLGAVVTWGRQWPIQAAAAFVGVFAVFHGHAHGVEIPSGASVALYSLGFSLATVLLHGAGMTVATITARQAHVGRLAGAAIAVGGLVLLIG